MEDRRANLAADLLAAERVIQFNAVHNPTHAAAAKAWLVELEHSALVLTARAGRPRRA